MENRPIRFQRNNENRLEGIFMVEQPRELSQEEEQKAREYFNQIQRDKESLELRHEDLGKQMDDIELKIAAIDEDLVIFGSVFVEEVIPIEEPEESEEE